MQAPRHRLYRNMHDVRWVFMSVSPRKTVQTLMECVERYSGLVPMNLLLSLQTFLICPCHKQLFHPCLKLAIIIIPVSSPWPHIGF